MVDEQNVTPFDFISRGSIAKTEGVGYLYWIRRQDHDDITSEGYVGITNDPYLRMKEHKTNLRKYLNGDDERFGSVKLYRALRKYQHEFVVTLVCCASYDYVSDLENKLRPTPDIGWNINAGGASGWLGRKHTDATKQKISDKAKRRERKKIFRELYGPYAPMFMNKDNHYVYKTPFGVYLDVGEICDASGLKFTTVHNRFNSASYADYIKVHCTDSRYPDFLRDFEEGIQDG